MGFYLYCIVPGGHAPPEGLTGVDDAPVTARAVDRVGVWESELDRPPRPALERLRAHDRVVRAAFAGDITPLPARFGQWFPDAETLSARISESSGRYEETLRSVAGAVEFGMRLIDPDSPSLPTAPPSDEVGAGRAYLRHVAERRKGEDERNGRGRELGRELRTLVDSLVADTRIAAPGACGELAQVAHLVRREEVGAYRRAVGVFRERHPELRVSLTGPWPPYSFGP